MNILSIDPGITGAIAGIRNGVVVWLDDLPVAGRGKDARINWRSYANLVAQYCQYYTVDFAVIEQVAAMPKQGVSSTFKFGETYGGLQAIILAQGLALERVTPGKWKGAMGLTGKDKDAARLKAIELHPEIAERLGLKKHHGRADAVMIGHYAHHHMRKPA